MSFIYRIQNLATNYTLEANTADNRTVTCSDTVTTETNQMWNVTANAAVSGPNHFFIQSLYSMKYLSVTLAQDSNVNLIVVADNNPYSWLKMDNNGSYMLSPTKEVTPPSSAYQIINDHTVVMGLGSGTNHEWLFTDICHGYQC